MNPRRRKYGVVIGALLVWALIAISGVSQADPVERESVCGEPPTSPCSLGPGQESVTWQGDARTSTTELIRQLGGCKGGHCENYLIDVNVDSEYWKTNSGGLLAEIDWKLAANRFTVVILDQDNKQVGEASTDTTDVAITSESVFLPEASGSYIIQVRYTRTVQPPHDPDDPDDNDRYVAVASFVSTPREQPCTGTPDHVWFLGIVYDEPIPGTNRPKSDSFKIDVRNFESFLSTLRKSYCIPKRQATILAMEKDDQGNDYRDPFLDTTYAEGSEANLKAELLRMGEESSQYQDSQFFFFLSSHGNIFNGALHLSACPPTRLAGSFSALKESRTDDDESEDGLLYDCELGDELSPPPVGSFSEGTRMFLAIDCSFCGGFSDSLTAVSGTVPDGSVPTPSEVPGPNRVVITGCAITTECFSTFRGGTPYSHMMRVLDGEIVCDGWTAPGFPKVQGFDLPVNGAPFNQPDGRCTASEWFFAAVESAYSRRDKVAIQQQFRIKYGFDSLSDDLVITGAKALVSFAPDSATSGQFSDQTLFSAHLRTADGNPVAGAGVQFDLIGDDGARTFDAITDENGIASSTPRLTDKPGAYQLIVRFDGGGGHQGSADTISFAILKEDTEVELVFEGRGKNRTLTARLFDFDTPSDGIEGATIDFYADGEFIGSESTGDGGVATLDAPPGYRGGPHEFEAVFEGDDFYESSSDEHVPDRQSRRPNLL